MLLFPLKWSGWGYARARLGQTLKKPPDLDGFTSEFPTFRGRAYSSGASSALRWRSQRGKSARASAAGASQRMQMISDFGFLVLDLAIGRLRLTHQRRPIVANLDQPVVGGAELGEEDGLD